MENARGKTQRADAPQVIDVAEHLPARLLVHAILFVDDLAVQQLWIAVNGGGFRLVEIKGEMIIIGHAAIPDLEKGLAGNGRGVFKDVTPEEWFVKV